MRVCLITARDPLAAGDGAHPLRTATALAADGHEVVLVLMEDAVAVAREGHRDAKALAAARAEGVRVIAEDEALARRGVTRIDESIEPAAVGEAIELLLAWSDRQAWL